MLDSLHLPVPYEVDRLRDYLRSALREIGEALDEIDEILGEIANGEANMIALPTADPRKEGRLWIAPDRTLKVSAGR